MWRQAASDPVAAAAAAPAVDEHGATLLHHAAKVGSVNVLEALLSLVNSPSHPLHALSGIRTGAGASPLHVAAFHGQAGAVRALLNTPLYRAEVNGRDLWRQTPLHYAALGGSVDVIDALAAAGATVDAQCERGLTPLLMAAAAGHAAAVRALAALGGNVNAKDWRESRALHYAAFHGRPAALTALLDAGATPDVRDRDQTSLLHYAALAPTPESFALLLPRFPPDTLHMLVAKHSSSVVHAAAAGGSDALLADLIARLGDNVLRVKNAHGAMPIHVAASRGRLRAVMLLLARAPDTLEAQDHARATPLLKAAYSGSVALTTYLLERGAAAEHLDEEASGVLHKAAWSGSADVINALLDAKPALAASQLNLVR